MQTQAIHFLIRNLACSLLKSGVSLTQADIQPQGMGIFFFSLSDV
jgi:hypothetical protein